MIVSRSNRLEDRKAKKRLALAAIGTIGFFVFVGVFGLKLLVGFSLLVDKIRGGGPTPTPVETVLHAPVLNPLWEATKSASFQVTGSGDPGLTAIIYIDDEEFKKTKVNQDGTFSVTLSDISEKAHTISAKQANDAGDTSDLSNILSITIKKTAPILELTSPAENSTINGDDNRVTVTGKTEEDTKITVNGRIVVVRSDNTFSYQHPLNNGDNKLTIIATDLAGNTTTIERAVKYER